MSSRAAANELGGNQIGLTATGMTRINQLQHARSGASTDFGQRNANGSQRREHLLRERDVVKADDGDIFGNAAAGRAQDLDGAKRQAIVGSQDTSFAQRAVVALTAAAGAFV